jgi:small-conductance mechanosensitive channel
MTPVLELSLPLLFEREVAGIPVERWAIALAVMIAGTLVLGVAKRLLQRRMQVIAARTETDVDDLLVDLLARTHRFFLVAIATYFAAHYLLAPYVGAVIQGVDATKAVADESPARIALHYIRNAVVIAALVQAGLWGRGLIAYGIQRVVRSRPAEDPARTMGASILGFLGSVFLWTLVVLLCLANLDVDVTALITGLGVGGIAVALALQNILGDLFASITILLDKPFVVGDSIKVADFNGRIERIGIKTTRMRSVDGEMIVMGNADLVSSRVRNYRQLAERRAAAMLGVSYATPPAVLARIPPVLREIVSKTPNARFDRAHFQGFADSALNFELVWIATTPDYALFTEAQQAINLAIVARFAELGIEFAYPTRTVLLGGDPIRIAPAAGPAGPPGQALPPGPQNELSRG